MYEWKSEYKPIEWIRIGENLIHLKNVNTVSKKGDGCRIRFADGHIAEFSDTPVREIAQLVGFEEIKGDSTAE